MSSSENKNYKVIITIDGQSAQDLFAVGPNDLKDYFLPEQLGVDPKDIRQIYMGEDLNADDFGAVMFGERTAIKHTDSFSRDDFDSTDCEA